MQWNTGYVPTYNDLSWCNQISEAIPGAVNLVFTTHAYRHSPYFSTQWGTTHAELVSQLRVGVQSMGVNAPLVINEAGSCWTTVTYKDQSDELGWWSALNSASKTQRIGVTAYYWMSDSDLGPVYSGEALLSGSWSITDASPLPNAMGQIFISANSASFDTRASHTLLPNVWFFCKLN